MSGGRSFDLERQMVIVDRVVAAHPDGITRKKLRSVLFLVDLQAYRELGQSLTGAVYQRGKHAPIVQGLTRTIRALRDEGRIR